MLINNVPVNAELIDILYELRRQLEINQIPLLHDIKDTPDNIMITCPYHKNGQERKPSAGVKKTDGTFHCFGCGEVHTLQELISFCFGHYDDMFGQFGWDWILKNFLTISVEERTDVKLDFSRTNSTNGRTRSDNVFVPDEQLEDYRYYHPYMFERKMTPEVIELFDVGYDKDSNCLTFPVRDIDGHCLFVARRSVVTKFFNYPAKAEKPVYGLYELGLQKEFPKEVIICESMIDAITCWVYGKYAVALNGLGNELQFVQLSAMPCRKFILATDNDVAGKNARKRIKQNIYNKLITEYVFPQNRKDINEMTREEFLAMKEIF